MVIIACRVIAPSLNDAVVGDDTAVHHCIEPFLIGPILTLFLIVESVQSYVLHRS